MARQRRRRSGNTMAQGTSVGRPHNSPLMKLAMRPRNSPIGATAEVRSPSDSIGMSRCSANSTHGDDAAEEAAMERHAAVPELQDLQRVRGEMRRVVEQHIADAAAEDDAERHPEDEVVDVLERHRRPCRPTAASSRISARSIEPAEQDAADIGERIPADGERARYETSTGSKAGKGVRENGGMKLPNRSHGRAAIRPSACGLGPRMTRHRHADFPATESERRRTMTQTRAGFSTRWRG